MGQKPMTVNEVLRRQKIRKTSNPDKEDEFFKLLGNNQESSEGIPLINGKIKLGQILPKRPIS
jgi:hypothetical protein